MQHELMLVGGGGGTEEYLLPVAQSALEMADEVIASSRFLHLVPMEKRCPMGNMAMLLEELPMRMEQKRLAILVSGDPLLYSLYRTIRNKYPMLPVHVIPGIGALQLLGASFGISMEAAFIQSMHGRAYRAGSIAYAVSQHADTFFFCSQTQGPKEIAAALLEYDLAEAELYVGADLTTPEQWLWRGTPAEFPLKKNPSLCVAAVRNPQPKALSYAPLLPDSAFLRNASPMTKEEVRAVIVSKLRLKPDAVVWDIGAGTGSVSITCARMCPFGAVYALEYQPSALEILEKNKIYFQTKNLQIISGRAEETVDTLPTPDCIFIGGSDRQLSALLRKIIALPRSVRLVMSAVTLETQAEAYAQLQQQPSFEAIQLAVSYAKSVGTYRVLDANHPVMLFACETKE